MFSLKACQSRCGSTECCGAKFLSPAAGYHPHLAWRDKSFRSLELPQCLTGLGRGRLSLGFRETSQHLMQRAERLLLEAETLSSAGQTQRRWHGFDRDVVESRLVEGLLRHA